MIDCLLMNITLPMIFHFHQLFVYQQWYLNKHCAFSVIESDKSVIICYYYIPEQTHLLLNICFHKSIFNDDKSTREIFLRNTLILFV